MTDQIGPKGTLFALGGKLVQEHTIVFSAALMPATDILWTNSQIVMRTSEGDPTRCLHTSMVGVNGGPEEAKKLFCEMIDKFWEEKPG